MTTKDNQFEHDLENDEVFSRSVITHEGKKLWPNPKPLPMLDAKKAAPKAVAKEKAPEKTLF